MAKDSHDVVLIVGGYGAVGRHIIDTLHRRTKDLELVVAGRNREKAEAFAGRYDDRVSGLVFDALDVASVDRAVSNTSLVVMNTEAGADLVAEVCTRHGVPMVSVAASVSVIRAINRLQDRAVATGTTLVTEVGLAPGLMNLMARQILRETEHVQSIDLFLQLGLIGHHGPEAISWTLVQASRAQKADRLDVPLPCGGKHAIPMDFIDRPKMAKELGVARVRSFLSISPNWAVRWLPPAARMVSSKHTLVLAITPLLTRLFDLLGMPTDDVKLCVRVATPSGSLVSSLSGRDQSLITGVVAAETALAIAEKRAPGGVIGMENLLDFDMLIERLEAIGCHFDEVGLGLTS